MEYLFGQIILVLMLSLTAVMVVCVLKNLIPKEYVSKVEGRSGIVASVLTAVAHSYAWFELGIYRNTTLFDIVPNLSDSSKIVMEYAWFVLLLVIAVSLNTALYRLVRGKLGIFGKSFSE